MAKFVTHGNVKTSFNRTIIVGDSEKKELSGGIVLLKSEGANSGKDVYYKALKVENGKIYFEHAGNVFFFDIVNEDGVELATVVEDKK